MGDTKTTRKIELMERENELLLKIVEAQNVVNDLLNELNSVLMEQLTERRTDLHANAGQKEQP